MEDEDPILTHWQRCFSNVHSVVGPSDVDLCKLPVYCVRLLCGICSELKKLTCPQRAERKLYSASEVVASEDCKFGDS